MGCLARFLSKEQIQTISTKALFITNGVSAEWTSLDGQTALSLFGAPQWSRMVAMLLCDGRMDLCRDVIPFMFPHSQYRILTDLCLMSLSDLMTTEQLMRIIERILLTDCGGVLKLVL